MQLRLPSSPWFFTIILSGLWIANISLVSNYFNRTQELEYYSPEADSIGIPIAGNAAFTIILAPVIALLIYRIHKKYPKHCGIFIWRKDRLAASSVITLISIGAFLILISSLIEDIRIELPKNAAADLLWIYVWITLRAVWISLLKPRVTEQDAAANP